MAWADCVAMLNKASGREGGLTDDEVDFVFSELQRRRNYLMASRQASDLETAARQAAEGLASDIELAAVVERRNTAMNLQKRVDRYEWLSQVFGHRVSEGIETLLVGTNRALFGARSGVAQIQNSLKKEYLSGFIYDLRDGGFDRLFAKGSLDLDVARAMWVIGKDNEAQVHAGLPAEAVSIAKIVNKWQETTRVDANSEGAWIGKLEGYIVRQSHDPYTITRAGIEKWKAQALRLFDIDRMLQQRADGTRPPPPPPMHPVRDELGGVNGGTPPAPGEKFIVYRLGETGQLANRNAANADGLARYIMGTEDNESPLSSKATKVYAFEVTADQPFGKYEGLNGAVPAKNQQVGRTAGETMVSYSFPEKGYTARLVATQTLKDLRARLKKDHGVATFDDAGSNKGAETIRAAFAESNAPAVPPAGMPTPPRGSLSGQSAGAVDAMLNALYVRLSTGTHMKADVEPTGFTGPANLAKKMSAHRNIHFKDADAWFEYNSMFGTKNLREAVISGLEKSAQSIGLMRVLGTNPEAMVQQLQDEMVRAAEKAGDTKQMDRLHKRQGSLDNYLAVVDGSASMPANQMGARWGAGIRGIQTMAKLGGMIASQLNDLAIFASAFRAQGAGYFDGMLQAVTGLGKSLTKPARFELLSSMDVVMDSMIGELGRSGSFFEPGSFARAQQLFMKLNLSQWWTERLRGAAGEGLSHHMALQTPKEWGALHPDYQRTLTTYGITPDDWNTIRAQGGREVEGKQFVTPDRIDDVEVQRKLRNYFIDQIGFAVVEPDAKTRAMMLGGTKAGTWAGEFVRFVMQFKSFTGAYMQKSLGRELYGRGYEGDSLIGALRNGNGEWQGIARLIGMSTLMGYASLTLKDLMKGRSPRDVTDPAIGWKVFLASAVQGGGAGIYGDLLFGDANRFGGGTMDTIAGPVATEITGMIDLYHRALRGDDVAASAFKTLINNTPFVNLFYTRILLDYMLTYDIQEQMNPGYLRRMEQRMQKDYGQHLLVSPH